MPVFTNITIHYNTLCVCTCVALCMWQRNENETNFVHVHFIFFVIFFSSSFIPAVVFSETLTLILCELTFAKRLSSLLLSGVVRVLIV